MKDSEIIRNEDGSIYHLNLLPSDIARDIILVGDPDRVGKVSKHFDVIEVQKQKREFVTHTGRYKGRRLTVLSTGIGAGNIDIALNELDALVNYDFEQDKQKDRITPLNFIRIGTSGCLIDSIPVDSFLISTFGIGLDGLLHYYESTESTEEKEIREQIEQIDFPVLPYVSKGSEELRRHFQEDSIYEGITVTCSGFYGPQGRTIRLNPRNQSFIDQLIEIGQGEITNLEMETAVIYGLANLLGHRAISLNLLLANRQTKAFSSTPKQSMERMIQWALDKILVIGEGEF